MFRFLFVFVSSLALTSALYKIGGRITNIEVKTRANANNALTFIFGFSYELTGKYTRVLTRQIVKPAVSKNLLVDGATSPSVTLHDCQRIRTKFNPAAYCMLSSRITRELFHDPRFAQYSSFEITLRLAPVSKPEKLYALALIAMDGNFANVTNGSLIVVHDGIEWLISFETTARLLSLPKRLRDGACPSPPCYASFNTSFTALATVFNVTRNPDQVQVRVSKVNTSCVAIVASLATTAVIVVVIGTRWWKRRFRSTIADIPSIVLTPPTPPNSPTMSIISLPDSPRRPSKRVRWADLESASSIPLASDYSRRYHFTRGDEIRA